ELPHRALAGELFGIEEVGEVRRRPAVEMVGPVGHNGGLHVGTNAVGPSVTLEELALVDDRVIDRLEPSRIGVQAKAVIDENDVPGDVAGFGHRLQLCVTAGAVLTNRDRRIRLREWREERLVLRLLIPTAITDDRQRRLGGGRSNTSKAPRKRSDADRTGRQNRKSRVP